MRRSIGEIPDSIVLKRRSIILFTIPWYTGDRVRCLRESPTLEHKFSLKSLGMSGLGTRERPKGRIWLFEE